MKKKLLIGLFLSLTGGLKTYAQTIIFDAGHFAIVNENGLTREAAENTHQNSLDKIKQDLDNINLNLSSVVLVQDMIHQALATVDGTLKDGAAFNVQIKPDEFKPPIFAGEKAPAPWYVNSDTLLFNNVKIKLSAQNALADYQGQGKILKEVHINQRKIIPDSKNLNGFGEADQVIDEQEIEKTGKITLGQLLEQKVKGFSVFGLWTVCPILGYGCSTIPYTYVLNNKRIHFIFDGMDLDKIPGDSRNKDKHFQFIKSYLDYFTAEDIAGIEVMDNLKYTGTYYNSFSLGDGLTNQSYCYIEITTHAKQGPYMKVTPGIYLYKPLAFTLPKQFYRPRYTSTNKNIAPGSDLRSTIHWEPNLFTDENGMATVSFFTADKPATYTALIEGTDLNGNLASQRFSINAKPKQTP